MDGTLLDSMGMWEALGHEFLLAHGKEPPKNLYDQLKVLDMAQTASYLREHAGISGSVEEIISEINRMAGAHYASDVPLKPYAAEFVHKLRERGVKCCVATATDRVPAETALRRLGLLDCFDFLLTCTEAGIGKESPRVFEQSLERLGTAKEDTVVFEDSLYAIETACGAGFRVAAVFDGSAAESAEQIRALSEGYYQHLGECEVENL